MARFASGRDAWGICDISGIRYPLREMKRNWKGQLVGPDWYEEKHPQLEPRTHDGDAQALPEIRPDVAEDTVVGDLELLYPQTAGGTYFYIFDNAIRDESGADFVLEEEQSTDAIVIHQEEAPS